MPHRLKLWLVAWTPLVWLVLELIKYPKNIPLSSGIVAIVKGFFAPPIGNYPPLFLLLAGAAVVAWGAALLLGRAASRGYPLTVMATGLALAAWGLVNGGLLSAGGFDLANRTGYFTWLCQTIVVLLVAACVWMWALEHPERAELTVRNAHRTWRLYRSNRQGMVGLWIIVAFVALALLAPFLANHALLAPDAQIGPAFQQPTAHYYHLMGTDDLGRSVLAEFIWSARISLVVGLMATIVSTVLGASIGIAAGYFGGWTGEIFMRITDAFLVIPWLPFAMVLAAAFGHNYVIVIVIIGVTSWPGTARVVRADALRVRELPFIERAKAIGSRDLHIMNKHVLPNVFPLIFANTILVVAEAITAETELSFLGLGDPLNFSWGTMLHYAWGSGAATLPAWWYIIPPGVAIVFVVLAFTFMGTAFDEILDPRLRSREDTAGYDGYAAQPLVAADVAVPLGGGGFVLNEGAPRLPYGMEDEEARRDRDT
jgi:peptide/nickel transport system permease protein